MLALAFVGKLCSVVFFFLAWWFYKPPGSSKNGNAVVPSVDLIVTNDKDNNPVGNGEPHVGNGYCNAALEHTEHL